MGHHQRGVGFARLPFRLRRQELFEQAVMADLDKTLTTEIQNNFGTYLQ